MNETNGVTRLPEWRELYEVAQTWEYGSIHSHADVAEIMRIKPLTLHYYTQVGRCRVELRRRNKRCLVSARTIGYRVALPNEHVGIADNDVDLAKERIKTAIEALNAVDVSLCTPEEINTLDRYTSRIYRVYGPIATEREQLKRIAAGKEPVEKALKEG